jgi:heme exporter protein A
MENQENSGLFLRAKDLNCDRGGRRVFEGLSFDVATGQAIILRGANGSGKSSLMRVLAGFNPPKKQTVFFQNEDVFGDMPWYRSNLHYVGHQVALKPVMSVRENLAHWGGMHGKSNNVGTNIEKAATAFGLTELLDLSVKFLSEGQQRRTALAKLVVLEKPLWLLDEPTNGLDRESLAAFIGVLKNHLAIGGTAIVATHVDIALENTLHLNLDDFQPIFLEPSFEQEGVE